MTDRAGMRVRMIRARLEKVTPGPWYRCYGDVVIAAPDPTDDSDEPMSARIVRAAEHRHLRDSQAIADAEFIAAAPSDIDFLLAALAAAESRVETLQRQVDQFADRRPLEVDEYGRRMVYARIGKAELDRLRAALSHPDRDRLSVWEVIEIAADGLSAAAAVPVEPQPTQGDQR